jgi:hypothetical protein
MVPYWPDIAKNHSETKAENEFADAFDSINKIVFLPIIRSLGRTLTSAIVLLDSEVSEHIGTIRI